jgi:hypothetical protein
MADLPPNFDTKQYCLFNHKTVIEALHTPLRKTAVCALHEQSTPIRSFTKTSNMQIKDVKSKR